MRFTLEDIEQAHRKVKTGADFPNYIQEVKEIGVQGYCALVKDGTTIYKDNTGSELISLAKYSSLIINSNVQKDAFLYALKKHQGGETSFIQFCQDCADCGIASWLLDLKAMRCTYFDINDQEVWTEMIPA